MRPIKFRAWDGLKKVMHYNFEFISSGIEGNDWIVFTSDKQPLDRGKNNMEETTHPFNNPYFAQQLKIMQFTGLLDKNGKEVFEGDIISRIRGISEIVWSDDGWAVKTFAGWKTQENVFCYQRFCEVGEIEIIGNIYETPELLKGGR